MAGKKGGASMASPKEKIVQEEQARMTEVEIKARIDKLFTDESRALRAIASANIGEYAIHGIKVLENEKGPSCLLLQEAETMYLGRPLISS